MSLQVKCDECGARYNVSEEKQGRKVRCKKCGNGILVSARRRKDASAPSGTSRRKRPQRAKQGSSGMPAPLLWALLIGTPVVLGLVAGAILLLRGGGDSPSEKPQQGEPIASANGSPPVTARPAVAKPVHREPAGPQPPPQEELALLEQITWENLRERMNSMQKREQQEEASQSGRNIQFFKAVEYTQPDGAFKILERVERTITNRGEQKSSTWIFEQTTPKYQGTFAAANFAVGGNAAARGRTGDVVTSGSWSLQFDDGGLRSRGTYQSGERHGRFMFWYSSGRRRWQGEYEQGQLVTASSYSDEEGAGLSEYAHALFDGHSSRVNTVKFSSDGQHLVSAGNSEIRTWDVAERRPLQKIPARIGARGDVGLAFSPDNSAIVLSSPPRGGGRGRGVRIWRLNDVSELLPGRLSYNAQLAPNGKLVFSILAESYLRSTSSRAYHVAAWDAATGQLKHIVDNFVAKPGNSDNVTQNQGQQKSISVGPPTSFAISPDSKFLAVVRHNRIFVRNLPDFTPYTAFLKVQEDVYTNFVAFSADSTSVLQVTDNRKNDKAQLVAWNLETRLPKLLIEDLGGPLPSPGTVASRELIPISPSADGKRMVAWKLREDKSLTQLSQFWSLETGQPIPVGGTTLAAVSPDQTIVVGKSEVGSRLTLNITNLLDGQQRSVPLSKEVRRIRETSFSADGKLLATIVEHTSGEFVRVWETTSWRSAELRGVEEYLTALAVSPNGRFLATGSRQGGSRPGGVPGFRPGTVSVWDLRNVKFEAMPTVERQSQ